MGIKALYQIICDISFIKKLIRHKMALFQEPDKNQAGNQADGTLIVELVIIHLVVKVVRETYDFNSPSIPVAQFLIEFFGKHLDRKAATQILSIDNTAFFIQVLIGCVIGNAFSQEITIPPWVAVISCDTSRIIFRFERNLNKRKTIIIAIVFRNKEYQGSVFHFVGQHAEGFF